MLVHKLLAAVIFAGIEVGSSSHLHLSTSPSRVLTTTGNVKRILHFSDVHLSISKSFNVTESIIDPYRGAQMWEVEYIATYKTIVTQFADIIKAQFFAHAHSIEFRVPLITEQQEQEAVGGAELVPLFMSAAISPIYNNNPAFMVWDFDATTYEVLDFTVYGTNISSDNQELNWQPLFKASTEYGVSSLRTSELNAFVKRATSNSALLEQYYYNSKAQSYLQSSCMDASCRAKWLCTMQWFTTPEDFLACVAKLEAGSTDVACRVRVEEDTAEQS